MKRALPHQKFAAEVKKRYAGLIDEYNAQITRARDEFQLEVHNAFLADIYHMTYPKIQGELEQNSRFLIEVKECLKRNRSKKFEELFDEEFKACTVVNKARLLRQLSQLQALDNFVLYIREEASKYSNPYAENIQNTRQNQFTDEAKNQVRWKGTTIDFVQLIYALQEAGYLDNEERQITSLVEQVSKIFNHHLSDHWQSNFSDNANNRNNDYQPKIFSNLMQAFESRRARLIESKRKNRLK